MVFLPLLILSVINSRIYYVLAHSSKRSLRQSMRISQSRPKRDQDVATILITIVIVFACCNIPRVSINLYEVSSIFITTLKSFLGGIGEEAKNVCITLKVL